MKKYSETNLKEKCEKIVAYIPVRGGSKGIPNKNIKLFCGMPLVYWVVKAAVECEIIGKVFVATENEQIEQVVKSFVLPKVSVISRSEESATDTASTEYGMLEFAEQYDFDKIVLIQATSPLLESEDLTQAIQKYYESKVDSLVSVVRQKRFLWKQEDNLAIPVNYNPSNRPLRQQWDGFLVENGAFYMTTKDRLLKSKCRISGEITAYEMHEETYFEIDDLADWIIAEQLKLKRGKLQSLSHIKLLISDVDGVLTDAGMYYSSDGQELKKFNTRDGKGIELIRAAGIHVMLLTSENIELVKRRGEKLKADYIFMGITDKKMFLEHFFKNHPEYSFNSTAYIGDDINDLECIQLSSFSAAPSDSHEEVRKYAKYICKTEGGKGCVREVCDLLIKERAR
ncbi:N-acylneuraminate cytidylyltransferase [Cohnella algarum]|uniref:N-acylneuraminate cytidylyltransferase n=1 Tax=Cohnella algarum TaxID=2044859 RepID=UPI001966EBBD|nr:N-acylneuraminate cytidylyltransferase [Cohnella algarum]MBN2980615.1 N-acylneuraminate cytidylyltransferase [Cohnella algarum]